MMILNAEYHEGLVHVFHDDCWSYLLWNKKKGW